MLDEMFPHKQLAVVDRIIYLTSGAGIAKVGAEKLAEKCEVSKRTVTSAVRALKETGEFIVGRLIKTKGGAGKYIFVDKKHPNFREIMREVFSFSDYKFAQLTAEQIAEQEIIKSVEAVSSNEENERPNINIYSTKQEKNKYVSNIANAIKDSIEEESTPSREYVEEYASNSLQIEFYDLLNGLAYPRPIDAVKHVLALRIGSDCDIKRFVKAKNIVHSISMRILDGYEFDNIPAAFTAALTKSESYEVPPIKAKPTYSKRSVSFYNWLNERE
ncbi:hypothetical protein [Ureibacillus sp. GCM10028918]|uniref:hypothetical protein n=1 Tax=Ureibacillus sp. GCM10028918 TaxID=3273429 RepID=UPI0036F2E472